MNADVHVMPSERGWRVEVDVDGRARLTHETQDARELAQRPRRELLGHARDRRIRQRNTYGRDPRKAKS